MRAVCEAPVSTSMVAGVPLMLPTVVTPSEGPVYCRGSFATSTYLQADRASAAVLWEKG